MESRLVFTPMESRLESKTAGLGWHWGGGTSPLLHRSPALAVMATEAEAGAAHFARETAA